MLKLSRPLPFIRHSLFVRLASPTPLITKRWYSSENTTQEPDEDMKKQRERQQEVNTMMQHATQLADSDGNINVSLSDFKSLIMAAYSSPQKRGFSSLKRVLPSTMGFELTMNFHFNNVVFKLHTISSWFNESIKKLEARWSLASEAGRRTLIDIYLLEALESYPDDVTIFTEFTVSKPVDIGNGFKLSGQIDYISSVFRIF
eukprot:TRINITY_DN2886_c0_g1_i2.p1 TRINITY_DN2886_c0_g1~~TRINITY_DN2886_c0_g1_i2.p1  ORF type:complete len:202 (+),score=21.40 TRINITY_DN2886_c0_g1_i2:47-652(+)